MTAATTAEIVALGAITGMRSMAGAAALGIMRGGALQAGTAMLATGEMVADKTPFIGNRTDPLPQAGRAVMGAVVGRIIAVERGESAWLGALMGTAAALVATHLAYRLRARLPVSSPVGGLLEDAVVVGAAALYVRRRELRLPGAHPYLDGEEEERASRSVGPRRRTPGGDRHVHRAPPRRRHRPAPGSTDAARGCPSAEAHPRAPTGASSTPDGF